MSSSYKRSVIAGIVSGLFDQAGDGTGSGGTGTGTGGTGTGTGGAGVDVAAARQFVSSFVPDPKLLETMKDDQVVAYHGSVSRVLEDHTKKALESYDWRSAIAGDDADRKKELERFQSPKAIYDTYKELRGMRDRGELRTVKPFPDKGTDEQKAQWRQENGVPPDGKYDVKLADGLVLGEEDKPLLEKFTKYAHENNVPGAEVNKVANWFFKERVEREAERAQVFETAKTDTAAELGREWGADYKPIQTKIQGLLDASIPSGEEGEKLKSLVSNAIATNSHFARMFAKFALELNPSGSMVPGDRGATEGNIADELKAIDRLMKDDRAAYNKDDAKQARYRELLGAYQKVTGKEWGRQ